MRPGHGLNIPNDSGLGPLGTVDRAVLSPGLLVPMHKHVDDEILSYLRSGVLHHRDEKQGERILNPRNLMLMNAGSGFSHEEKIPPHTREKTEMLQIFVRPREVGLQPMIQFCRLENIQPPETEWRLIAAPPGSGAPMILRNEVWVRDRLIPSDQDVVIPISHGHSVWMHVFSGSGSLGGHNLTPGDSVIIEGETHSTYLATEDSVLVVFTLNRHATVTRHGTLSI
jgi:redox-sensitive bicupin YhaK (pirin superfamily)